MYFGVVLLIIGILLVLPKIPIIKTLLGIGLILMGLSIYLNKDVEDLIKLDNIVFLGKKILSLMRAKAII